MGGREPEREGTDCSGWMRTSPLGDPGNLQQRVAWLQRRTRRAEALRRERGDMGRECSRSVISTVAAAAAVMRASKSSHKYPITISIPYFRNIANFPSAMLKHSALRIWCEHRSILMLHPTSKRLHECLNASSSGRLTAAHTRIRRRSAASSARSLPLARSTFGRPPEPGTRTGSP